MDFAAILSVLQNMGGLEVIGAVTILLILSKTPQIISWIKNKKNKKNPHINCDNYQDLKYVVDQAIKRAIRVFDIREYKTLHEQMNIVDRSAINCKSILMEVYKDRLEKSVYTYKDRDIRSYDKILDYLMWELKKVLRDWIRSNHILEKKEDEWLTYVKNTIKTLIQEGSSIFDKEYYSDDFCIDRTELKHINEGKVVHELEEILQKTLFDIREISRDKAYEIEKLEKEEFFCK